jgi:hypothetical protein
MHSKDKLITQLRRRAQNEVISRLEVPDRVIEERAIPRDARNELVHTLHEQISSMRGDMHSKDELITQLRRRAQNGYPDVVRLLLRSSARIADNDCERRASKQKTMTKSLHKLVQTGRSACKSHKKEETRVAQP